jgi:hypothetical protein
MEAGTCASVEETIASSVRLLMRIFGVRDPVKVVASACAALPIRIQQSAIDVLKGVKGRVSAVPIKGSAAPRDDFGDKVDETPRVKLPRRRIPPMEESARVASPPDPGENADPVEGKAAEPEVANLRPEESVRETSTLGQPTGDSPKRGRRGGKRYTPAPLPAVLGPFEQNLPPRVVVVEEPKPGPFGGAAAEQAARKRVKANMALREEYLGLYMMLAEEWSSGPARATSILRSLCELATELETPFPREVTTFSQVPAIRGPPYHIDGDIERWRVGADGETMAVLAVGGDKGKGNTFSIATKGHRPWGRRVLANLTRTLGPAGPPGSPGG